MDKGRVLEGLLQCGVVAVIRAPSAELLPAIARALVDGGVTAIEVTMSTPNAIEGIAQLAKTMGDAITVGSGTILDAQTCRQTITAGARFVVAPVFDAGTVKACNEAGVVAIPGAYTPTEILAAWRGGADLVKVFPATALGPKFFGDVLAPMPFLRLTPTGGVDVGNAADFIRAGAVCVGAGSSLVSKQAMSTANWPAITTAARGFVEAVQRGRAR